MTAAEIYERWYTGQWGGDPVELTIEQVEEIALLMLLPQLPHLATEQNALRAELNRWREYALDGTARLFGRPVVVVP